MRLHSRPAPLHDRSRRQPAEATPHRGTGQRLPAGTSRRTRRRREAERFRVEGARRAGSARRGTSGATPAELEWPSLPEKLSRRLAWARRRRFHGPRRADARVERGGYGAASSRALQEAPHTNRVHVRKTPSLAIGGSAHRPPSTRRTGSTPSCFSCRPGTVASVPRIGLTGSHRNPDARIDLRVAVPCMSLRMRGRHGDAAFSTTDPTHFPLRPARACVARMGRFARASHGIGADRPA